MLDDNDYQLQSLLIAFLAASFLSLTGGTEFSLAMMMVFAIAAFAGRLDLNILNLAFHLVDLTGAECGKQQHKGQ